MRIFFAEWRKLRRPAFFLGTMGSVIFVTGLVSSLLFLLIDAETGNADRGNRITREMLQLPDGFVIGFNSASGLLGLVALSVFAAQTAQEYTYGTLRNLLVRQPRRIRLLLGKYLSMISFALVTVIVSAATAIGLAFGLAGRARVATDAWTTSTGQEALLHSFVNVFISTIGYGTIGMLLGLIFRSPISSISIGTAYLLVVESIISIAWKPAANWMPGNLLSVVGSGGSPIGVENAPTYSQALLRVGLYLLGASLITATLFKRRDVAN
ncbi:MAG: ABC transporter permease [Candidatus Nanopelagicaceae bacterium]|jgi:ABC-2 type transport system permease protein